MHTSSEAEAARHFGIPRTTIRGWKGLDKQPVDRTRKKSHAKKGKNKAGAGRPLSYNEDIDMELCQWILEMRDLHLPVQRKHVQRKAMALIQPTQPSFKASAGWKGFSNDTPSLCAKIHPFSRSCQLNWKKSFRAFCVMSKL